MTPNSREQLRAALQAAGQAGPSPSSRTRLPLVAAPGHAWENGAAVEAYAHPLRCLASPTPVPTRSMPCPSCCVRARRVAAHVCDDLRDSEGGRMMNFVVLYEDSASITFTTTRDL